MMLIYSFESEIYNLLQTYKKFTDYELNELNYILQLMNKMVVCIICEERKIKKKLFSINILLIWMMMNLKVSRSIFLYTDIQSIRITFPLVLIVKVFGAL